MLNRLYQTFGVALLAGYGLMSLTGWELGNPVVLRPAPPVGAAIARSSGWSGRYWTYHSYSSYSSGTRSGVGGGGSGGK